MSEHFLIAETAWRGYGSVSLKEFDSKASYGFAFVHMCFSAIGGIQDNKSIDHQLKIASFLEDYGIPGKI